MTSAPVFPGRRYEDWVLDDLAGLDLDDVRPIRDEIERHVRRMLAELEPYSSSGLFTAPAKVDPVVSTTSRRANTTIVVGGMPSRHHVRGGRQ
jgi:hypothetical protein